MKKLLSFILGIGLLFNNSLIFAMKDDPLTDEDYKMIRIKFKSRKDNTQDPNCHCLWRKKANTSIFSDDYREIKVCNMPYLLATGDSKVSFVSAIAKLAIKARKAAEKAKRETNYAIKVISEAYAKLFAKNFSEDFANEIKDGSCNRCFEIVADKLGVSFDIAKESCEIYARVCN